MSTNLQTIRVLEFDGRAENYDGWSSKFEVRGDVFGYSPVLRGTMKVPSKSELDADPNNDELKNAHNLNVQAYRDIMLSVKHDSKHGKVAFGLIKNCKSKEYPEGNAKRAWDRLQSKYAPETAPSLLKLKKKFANSKLQHDETHPDE